MSYVCDLGFQLNSELTMKQGGAKVAVY